MCYLWAEWPEREDHFPATTKQDVGIDAVAIRRGNEYVAIQCKSRQLDDDGNGARITATTPKWSESFPFSWTLLSTSTDSTSRSSRTASVVEAPLPLGGERRGCDGHPRRECRRQRDPSSAGARSPASRPASRIGGGWPASVRPPFLSIESVEEIKQAPPHAQQNEPCYLPWSPSSAVGGARCLAPKLPYLHHALSL